MSDRAVRIFRNELEQYVGAHDRHLENIKTVNIFVISVNNVVTFKQFLTVVKLRFIVL